MAEEMKYATIEELTAPGQVPEDDVQLGDGRWIRVRGLTRAEAIKLQGIGDAYKAERYALSLGMLIPRMNEPQVDAWLRAVGAGSLEPASSKINQLSGMAERADKEAVRDFESGKVDEFRVLSRNAAESDGGDLAADNE